MKLKKISLNILFLWVGRLTTFFYTSLWLHWVLVVTCALHCRVQAPECAGSKVVVLEHICSVTCGILVPWPGIKPKSLALQGRFLTTGPPGKSQDSLLLGGKAFQNWPTDLMKSNKSSARFFLHRHWWSDFKIHMEMWRT